MEKPLELLPPLMLPPRFRYAGLLPFGVRILRFGEFKELEFFDWTFWPGESFQSCGSDNVRLFANSSLKAVFVAANNSAMTTLLSLCHTRVLGSYVEGAIEPGRERTMAAYER